MTASFLLGSGVILIFVALGAAKFGRDLGESTTVSTGIEFTQAEADLLANSYGRFFGITILDEVPSGFDADSIFNVDSTGLSIELFIQNELAELGDLVAAGDLQHIGVLDPHGTDLWSIGIEPTGHIDAESFQRVLGGATVSFLNRDAVILNAEMEPVTADLIESYVPLSLHGRDDAEAVLHIAKNVTELLAANIAANESIVRRAMLTSALALLGALSVLVFFLDLSIMRRTRASVAKERSNSQKLDLQNAELQRLDKAKNEFLSNLSHELKTPLASILGFTRIVKSNKRDSLTGRDIRHLNIVDRNGMRLDALINDLLDLSRVQSQRIKLIPQETELTALLNSSVEAFEVILRDRGQSISLVTEHPEVWLDIDPMRITQVISNLINNASKYSPDFSAVTVTSRVDGDDWVVSVEDRGQGIGEEFQGQLFTMFYRTPEAQASAIPGTGIGLYISKQIVDLHGGHIGLQSAPGEGTTVTVRIPGVRTVPVDHVERTTEFVNTLDQLDDLDDIDEAV